MLIFDLIRFGFGFERERDREKKMNKTFGGKLILTHFVHTDFVVIMFRIADCIFLLFPFFVAA